MPYPDFLFAVIGNVQAGGKHKAGEEDYQGEVLDEGGVEVDAGEFEYEEVYI